MINPYDALELIISNINEVGFEYINVTNAINRIAYDNVKSNINLPSFDNSVMDGYAIKYEGFEKYADELKIIGTIKAGDLNNYTLDDPKTCYKIMTGAKLPSGADTVVEYEKTENPEPDICKIVGNVKFGANIRKVGEDIKKGDYIEIKGKRLKPWDISRLISAGISNIKVYRKIKVAVLATGDELIMPGDQFNGGVYDSNSFAIKTLLELFNIDVNYLGISKDSIEEFEKIFDSFQKYDAIISSAGISFGDFDVVTNLFKAKGIEFLFKSVKQKPGKPFSFALLDDGTPYFALPGNPVSSFFCTYFYVLPALRKMMGEKDYQNKFVYAKLGADMHKKNNRFHFNRVTLKYNEDTFIAMPYKTQDSHIISSLFYGNAFALIDDEIIGTIKAGEKIKCYIYDFNTIF
ncbi:molybdopterin molybdotransferase MoeA [Deferribacter thermophilus]|uniref:molybdopterin molybdotransferase MoeA n=1 Tax=Deferribacter thermophilus TaxID=53573 RepID=UPI003C24E05C